MEYVVVYTLMVSITAMFGWFAYLAHTSVKEVRAEKAAIALVLKKKAKKQRLSKKKRVV